MFTGYQVLVIGLGAFLLGFFLGTALLLQLKVLEWKETDVHPR